MPGTKKPKAKPAARRAGKPDQAGSSPDPDGAAFRSEQGPPVAPGSAADQIDEQLARYRSMRDFGLTAEPSGSPEVDAGEPASPKRRRAAASRPGNAAAGSGAARKSNLSGGLPFVIQKHAASHLHYDFRLGWAGVLKSWACAKGPSYVTGDRRLAVQVEDHPMEYGGFEGTIPKGQYGGGTVMVWDQGTWWPQPGHENVDAGLRDGSLKFEMNGTRMKGKWTLVRMNSRPGEKGGRWGSSSKPNWLLIKEHDGSERPAGAPAITDEALTSAVTGRTMEEIARETDHVWNSKETAGTGQAWYRREPGAGEADGQAAASAPTVGTTTLAASEETKSAAESAGKRRGESREAPASDTPGPERPSPGLPASRLKSLPKEAQPTFIPPQLALEAANPPDTAGWLHELKLDGYRIQARKTGREVTLLTRSGLDWTHRVPSMAAAVARLPVETVTLDGEVVVLNDEGNTDFARLQASFQEGARHPLTFFCFDLLHLEGRNPRELSLRERKALLAGILADSHDEVRLSEHIDSGGEAVFQKACELHAEGILSKRASAPYHSGRNGDWLKAKCLHEQEFVIGGFTLSSDGPDRIGSLLLGYYEPAGQMIKGDPQGGEPGRLVYAGRSGTGFTQKSRRSLREHLQPLERKSAPFVKVPTEARRGALWVEPRLVGQVRFASWTAEDLVRQAAFLGLREDKAPEEVFRNEPSTAPLRKGSGRERAPVAPQTVKQAGKQPAKKAIENRSEAAEHAASGTPSASAGKKGFKRAHDAHDSSLPSAAASSPAPTILRLTHPNKVLDPESRLTKRQLADYYWAVAPHMLPHVAGRPLSLVRCPDGAGKPCFYQKHVNHMLPAGVTSVEVTDKKTGKSEPYITLHTAEALAGLAQMGVLEIHPWGSRNEDLERPDRLIFDLDPDEALAWPAVCAAAAEVRERLDKIGLASFLKTTGGKGLHIVAPIEPGFAWPEIKTLAQLLVLSMERDAPQRYLTRMTKAARRGKIYLDYLRNERGATAVAPFSPRARLGVNASVPLPWAALREPERPAFPVHRLAVWQDRLHADPWESLPRLRQRLSAERIKAL